MKDFILHSGDSEVFNEFISDYMNDSGFEFFSFGQIFFYVFFFAIELMFATIFIKTTKAPKSFFLFIFIPFLGVFITCFACVMYAASKKMTNRTQNGSYYNSYNRNVGNGSINSTVDKRYSTINSHYSNNTLNGNTNVGRSFVNVQSTTANSVNAMNAKRQNAMNVNRQNVVNGNRNVQNNRVLNNINENREIPEYDATKATLNECNTHSHSADDSYTYSSNYSYDNSNMDDFYNFEKERTYKLNGEVVEYDKNVCKHCGGVLKAFSRKCPECGAKIKR